MTASEHRPKQDGCTVHTEPALQKSRPGQARPGQPFATIRVSNRGLANDRLANYGLGLVRQHTAVSLALGGTQLSVQNLEGTGRRLLRAGDQSNSYSQLQASLDYNLPISKERRKRKAVSQSP